MQITRKPAAHVQRVLSQPLKLFIKFGESFLIVSNISKSLF